MKTCKGHGLATSDHRKMTTSRFLFDQSFSGDYCRLGGLGCWCSQSRHTLGKVQAGAEHVSTPCRKLCLVYPMKNDVHCGRVRSVLRMIVFMCTHQRTILTPCSFISQGAVETLYRWSKIWYQFSVAYLTIKKLGWYAPEPLRPSSLIISHDASQSATGKHSTNWKNSTLEKWQVFTVKRYIIKYPHSTILVESHDSKENTTNSTIKRLCCSIHSIKILANQCAVRVNKTVTIAGLHERTEYLDIFFPHITQWCSVSIQRITLNVSCITISGGRTEQLD